MMASKKPSPPVSQPEEKEEFVKFSFLVHADLDRQIQAICNQRRISRSVLFREVLEENLDKYRQQTAEERAVLSKNISIQLNDATRELLLQASHDINLSPESIIQLLLTRSLVTFVEEARATHQKVAALLSSHEPREGKTTSETENSRSAAGKSKRKDC